MKKQGKEKRKLLLKYSLFSLKNHTKKGINKKRNFESEPTQMRLKRTTMKIVEYSF